MPDDMDEDDQFDNDFGDIDAEELIEAAKQVENQAQTAPLGFSDNASTDGVDKLLETALNDRSFNNFDELEEVNEISRQRTRSTGCFSHYRQRTLLGGLKENERPPHRMRSPREQQNANYSTPPAAKQNWRMVDFQEPPTHHRIDKAAASTWVYPINYAIRDYQFNIVHRALLNNVLVTLPTGLGKTFIAAVVMYNWYRWVPDAQIAFMAPTKPLIAQQVDACYDICGIPKSQTALITGKLRPVQRAELWEKKRVFFATPQTLEGDLKRGYADPKKLVCLVIDEAHRAIGNFSYVKVVEFIRRFNSSFRVLALTATPGSKVETVQGVIDALGISRVEIRTEESLDIRQYIHQKNVETVAFELPDEISSLKDAFAKCLQPILDDLRSKKAIHINDAERLSAFNVSQAQSQWMKTPAFQNMGPAKHGIIKKLQFLAQLAYPMMLIQLHGVRCFHNYLRGLQDGARSNKAEGKTMRANFFGSSGYKELISDAEQIVQKSDFLGHPKLEYLIGAVLRHFVEARETGALAETRVIIFSSYRDSASIIVDMLKAHEPTVKPSIFVGQQDGKAGAGMSQKEQLAVIANFQKGTYNTLVATSVGEEGLDIGEVDLIICYDAHASPIRMLQRMGRTGRKRNGNIIILLTKGKEEDKLAQAKDNYTYIQNMIAAGDRLKFRHDLSPRILPKEIVPQCDKQHIVPVAEESVATPSRKTKIPQKAPPKKFHMPDGVQTGFVKASKAFSVRVQESSGNEADGETNEEMNDVAPAWDLASEAGLLKPSEEKELQRNYMTVFGAEEDIFVAMPNLEAHPEAQRTLTPTKWIGHGRGAKSLVRLMNLMRELDRDDRNLDLLRANLHMEDVESYFTSTANTKDLEGSSAGGDELRRMVAFQTSPPLQRRRNETKESVQIASNDTPIDISSDQDSPRRGAQSPSVLWDTGILYPDIENLREASFGTSSDNEDLPDISTMLNSVRKRAKNNEHPRNGEWKARKRRRIEDDDSGGD